MFWIFLRQCCCTFKVRLIKTKVSERKSMTETCRQILKMMQSLAVLPLNDKKRIKLILVWSLRVSMLGFVEEKLQFEKLLGILLFSQQRQGGVIRKNVGLCLRSSGFQWDIATNLLWELSHWLSELQFHQLWVQRIAGSLISLPALIILQNFSHFPQIFLLLFSNSQKMVYNCYEHSCFVCCAKL